MDRGLAAFHGHLPLLQELLRDLESRLYRSDIAFILSDITTFAGESSSSQSLLLCLYFGF